MTKASEILIKLRKTVLWHGMMAKMAKSPQKRKLHIKHAAHVQDGYMYIEKLEEENGRDSNDNST